ncbi:MAG: hypothetical protein KF805_09840 [Phycisphaeraceae bacterium]|nr:hypothetical protein [Phycisphaeraceae bacterium]
MRQISLIAAAAVVACAAGNAANAGYSFIQSASAQPTYANVLNFDAPGSPTGACAGNAFASFGVSSLVTGTDPGAFVSQVNATPGFGWLGTGNVAYGSFGLYMTFDSQVSQLSVQYWDTSGPASFFGGGAALVLKKAGVEVGSLFITNPAFGPTGQSWFNITTDGGSTFDEIDFVGFGFPADAYIDNVSWTKVPTPASATLLAFGGVLLARRRRA